MIGLSHQAVLPAHDDEPHAAAPRRSVFVKSYGCQMNAYDAGRMVDALAPAGFDETSDIAQADLVILNTCHIRERAVEKIFSELGKVRVLKQAREAHGRETLVAVAGCVAQAEGAEIFRRQRAVDLIVGPQSYHRLPDLVARARLKPGVIDTDFPVEDKFEALAPPAREAIRRRGPTAFVTVQEGCDKFCTFCVVPYTRGAEWSRAPEAIEAEVARLLASGVREVTLLGQNVNAYHGEDADGRVWTLAGLMGRLALLPGLARLRYTTSHPNDMGAELVAAHGSLPALMPFLHLPVQSGSDRVLAAMNRQHTAQAYRDLVADVRRVRPDVAISSDFIVGFPGETEAEFEATMTLVRDIGFASAYSFKYSARPGTPAAELGCAVDPATMLGRLHRLQALLDDQRHAYNAAMVGRTVPVLFDKPGRHPGQVAGRTPTLQPVQVEADPDIIGTVREVDIARAGSNSLFGRLAGDSGHHQEQRV